MKGPNISRNHWYDVLLHIKWGYESGGANEGSVTWWLDGVNEGTFNGSNLFYAQHISDNNSTRARVDERLSDGHELPRGLPTRGRVRQRVQLKHGHVLKWPGEHKHQRGVPERVSDRAKARRASAGDLNGVRCLGHLTVAALILAPAETATRTGPISPTRCERGVCV